MTGPVEATAIGNILMQAITLGYLSSLAEARALVRASFDVETYIPAQMPGWDEEFAKLQTLMNS
jgi:rhamnulokinase